MSAPLTKVDSAIAGLSIDEKPPASTHTEVKKDSKKGHRRTSSVADGVWNIKDLGEPWFLCHVDYPLMIFAEEQQIEITLPIETQKTGW